MNEEIRKNAEINDDELEQVSGGVVTFASKMAMKQCDSPEGHQYDIGLEECPICKSRKFKFIAY